jgi:CBS domain-containing protein
MTTPTTTVRKRPGEARLHHVSAGEAMHRGVLCVPLHTPLTKVAQMMARYGVHCIVALDERGEYLARVWGLIPAGELIRIATRDELENRTAGASATSGVVTVEPADSVYHAARLMAENDVDHVIVVDPVSNRPVGILSTLDVARVLAGEPTRTPRGAYHVAQVMTRNVLTVRPDTPLRDVARLMTDHGISGVPVVEKGSVLGIVSQADIVAKERGSRAPRGRLSRWFRRAPRPADTERLEARTAGEAMTAPAITIESWRIVADAAALMLDRRVHRLPVLEDGTLVGIVTRADLVSAFARSDEEIALDIREDVLLRSFWITPGDIEVLVRNGEVTLKGTVESDLLAQVVPETVQRVPGVVRVKPRLAVSTSGEPQAYFEQLFPNPEGAAGGHPEEGGPPAVRSDTAASACVVALRRRPARSAVRRSHTKSQCSDTQSPGCSGSAKARPSARQ